MEPSGRNRRQRVANGASRESGWTRRKPFDGLRLVAAGSDGKEGVDGSSPSEGSQKFLLISPF
jgi:hypothetical protein